jgi:3-phenylpropionate/cinnamic acid dioxygenase small subunit
MAKADGMKKHILLSRADAEAFLYMESRLLDEDRLEEWLDLYTPDGIYWLPSDEQADPDIETSIIHDDDLQRRKRIFQLRQRHLAQDPRSRTIHLISNVEVEADQPDGTAVRCNMLIMEMRPGDHQRLQPGLAEPRTFGARCLYRLRRIDDGWRIALKQVTLINRDLPLRNISFIL